MDAGGVGRVVRARYAGGHKSVTSVVSGVTARMTGIATVSLLIDSMLNSMHTVPVVTLVILIVWSYSRGSDDPLKHAVPTIHTFVPNQMVRV